MGQEKSQVEELLEQKEDSIKQEIERILIIKQVLTDRLPHSYPSTPPPLHPSTPHMCSFTIASFTQ